ncbi:MAG: RidA family protein [Flavobacteriales bacterium]|nr:RidA family protein [Bacteroidota bacterium]MCB9241296.1 RidA family protein [Flavobacteriales bacterium]
MTSREIIHTDKAPAAIGPYSQAVKVGNTLYCSGQICIDPSNGELNNATIEAETQQVMKNIGAVLEAAGMDYSNVVKVTIFMRDMGDYAAINGVYAQYFTTNPPAREAVAVKTLPKEVGVEISVTAVQ